MKTITENYIQDQIKKAKTLNNARKLKHWEVMLQTLRDREFKAKEIIIMNKLKAAILAKEKELQKTLQAELAALRKTKTEAKI